MKNVDLARKNYSAGYWTKGNLKALVAKGRLTQEELDSIVINEEIEEADEEIGP